MIQKESRSKKSGSLITCFVLLAFYLISLHLIKPWQVSLVQGGGDALGYYLYLPAVLIHNDLKSFERSHEAIKRHKNSTEADKEMMLIRAGVNPVENGNQLNKYTIGVAFLHSPFFLIAHALALAGLGSADGYDDVYIYLAHLGSLFYVCLGFFFLRSVLRHYFSDLVTSVALAAVALGTNLYYFTVLNALMSHSYLFFLYCVLIYFTVKWLRTEKAIQAAAIGICAGLITLIRPVEIISLFIPLLWGISRTEHVTQRWIFLKRNWKSVALAAAAFTVMGLPQLIYWKSITGSFVYYSYSEEGFNFLDPQLLPGIFGYRNGWLAYTPVMYLAIFGIIFFSKRKDFFFPILAFLPLHLYIIYSWWCWYYINGFGSRPMVETYALLSFPLAAFVSWSLKRKLATAITIAIIAFLSWINIFQTYQFWKGIMWSEDGNWAFYRESLGKIKLDYEALVSYDTHTVQPEENDLEFEKNLLTVSYPDSSLPNLKTVGPDNRKAIQMGGGNEFGYTYVTTLRQAGLKPGQWLRIEATCLRAPARKDLYLVTRLVCQIADQGEPVDWVSLRLDNKPGNAHFTLWGGVPDIWSSAHFWVQIPKGISEEAEIKIFPWNASDNLLYISHLKIDAYSEK